jgi:hypothetical protein
MVSTRLYREQHTRIRALCRPLLDPKRTSASPPALRAALAKLAGSVKLHLRDEDGRFYPRLLRDADDAVRSMAAAFQASMGNLAVDFAQYYEKWVRPDAIDAERARFFAETDRILDALLDRIEREDRELYERVDRTER